MRSVGAAALITSFVSTTRLAATPDGQWLFVTQNFSPNTLYRLDLSAEDAPVVAISPHGARLSGARMLEISADGERLYLGSGQVISPKSLMPIGRIGAGVPRPAPGDEYMMVGSGARTLERYDTRSEVLLERFETDCGTAELTRIAPAAGGRWLLLGGDILCSIAIPAQP
jgi:hypothetical protein